LKPNCRDSREDASDVLDTRVNRMNSIVSGCEPASDRGPILIGGRT
jgi:hypothetical protein